MVENRDFPLKKGITNDGAIGLAAPKDRLASYIVDALLLLPIVQLLQSPFKRWILESFVFGEEGSVVWFRVVNLIIFVLVFMLYYTLMTFWGGQTIGKIFFSIKTISYQGKISLMNAFSRSLFILFEIVCLGIPFLGVFSHALRRPMHDRLADTLVISLKSPVGFPSRGEKWRAQAATVALGSLFFITVFVYAFMLSSVKNSVDVFSKYENSCSSEIESSDKTLNAGIELFMAEKISEQCLFKHSRDFIWLAEDSDLAHLAIALSYVEDEDRSNEYLREVCKSNSTGMPCVFSQWISSSAPLSNTEPFVKRIFSDEKVHNFYRVYAASAYQKQGMHQAVINLMKLVSEDSHLQSYISLLSFESLLGQMKWQEAYWVYQTNEYVNYQQVLKHINNARNAKRLSVEKQITLLEMFFPKLKSKKVGVRGLASVESSPDEILSLYNELKEEL